MKGKVLVIFLLLSLEARALCLPDLEVPIETPMVNPALDLAAARFLDTAERLIPTNLDLTLRLDVLNPRVNAEITRSGSEITLLVMGGMLSRPELSEDGLILLLCHELGHLLGGDPKKSRGGWSSTEGQADYYSTSSCIRNFGITEDEFLTAALDLTTIYGIVMNQAAPRLESRDQTVAERINFGYPSLQCRLDTLVAGWQGTERPRCWFPALKHQI